MSDISMSDNVNYAEMTSPQLLAYISRLETYIVNLEADIDKLKVKTKDTTLNKSRNDKDYEFICHPKHYNTHPSGVECITIIQHFTANIAFAVKHLWRAGLKPGDSTTQDIEKAIEYLKFELARVRSQDKLDT